MDLIVKLLLPLVILFVLTWIGDTTNTCEWDVNVDNQNLTLDLQAIAGQKLQCALDGSSHSHPFGGFEANWMLVYTPCDNGFNCSVLNGTDPRNVTQPTMVSQLQTNKSRSCIPVLPWDSGKTGPIYVYNDNTKKQQYIFEYKNGFPSSGNCTKERHLNVTYICDEHIDTYNSDNITCKELPYNINDNGICKYEMIIPTKLACLSEPDDDKPLSAAWKATIWLGIIFGTIFICYCCIGYAMNATRQHQWFDIMNNIPNANIWCCCCYKGKEYITIQDSNGLINDDRDNF